MIVMTVMAIEIASKNGDGDDNDVKIIMMAMGRATAMITIT